MQINGSTYIEIKVPGVIDSDCLEDISSLMYFEASVTAGVAVPTVAVSFRTTNKKVVDSIQEKNPIAIWIGNSLNDCSYLPVIIDMSNSENSPGGGEWIIEFTGFVGSKSFVTNQASESITGNSLQVAHEIFNREFVPDLSHGYTLAGYSEPAAWFNYYDGVSSPIEKQMVWRRTNTTASYMMAETLLHMNLYPAFPLFSFNMGGIFSVLSSDEVFGEPDFYLSPQPPQNSNEFQFVQSFSVKNDRNMYNLFAGYSKRINVLDSGTGKTEVIVDVNKPILASTQEAETSNSGSTVSSNDVQSDNVHKTYKSCFRYNTNKLAALSAIQSTVTIIGYANISPLQLASVNTGDERDSELGGRYLVEGVTYKYKPSIGSFVTQLLLCRDNKNQLEDSQRKVRGLNISPNFIQNLCTSVALLRQAYARGKMFIDGRYMKRLLSFALASKRNLLRMFSIAGINLDFNNSAALLRSLILLGNSLMNSLISMIFPETIARIFRDFLLRKPSLLSLLKNYIARFVPFELRGIIISLIDALFSTTDSLNSIAKENNIYVGGTGSTITKGEMMDPTHTSSSLLGPTFTNVKDDQYSSEIDYTAGSDNKVNNIFNIFENNLGGLDVPFPIINLTESQAIMPEDSLKDFIAKEVINNLTNLGYLKDVDVDEFKDILVGDKPIDFEIIEQIEQNAGAFLKTRIYGTFNEMLELTSFHIKNGFKDKYKSLPCTKLINATMNSKIFFACPSDEDDVKFYISSKRVELPSFEIELGYKDAYGQEIPYTVYYTEKGYNSNSVLFEVKQGGMV